MACLAAAQLGSCVPLYALIALRQTDIEAEEATLAWQCRVWWVGVALLLRPTAVIKFNNANVIKSHGQLQTRVAIHTVSREEGREDGGQRGPCSLTSNGKCTRGNAFASLDLSHFLWCWLHYLTALSLSVVVMLGQAPANILLQQRQSRFPPALRTLLPLPLCIIN